jgi:hypothetical protein
MHHVPKILLMLSVLAFLLAVFVGLFWPIFGYMPESFSRASNNLALLAIGFAVCWTPRHPRNP